MFDKLIESEPEGAEFKSRRSYFMVSSLVVGVLFTTAVVISIYAADIGLGHSNLDLVELIAPPEMAPVEPETPQPRQNTAQTQGAETTRQANIARIEETPPSIPDTTSVVRITQAVRPPEPFVIGRGDIDGPPSRPPGPETGPVGLVVEPVASTPPVEPGPPPVVTPRPVKPISGGVVNGNATSLPVPAYSAAARAVKAQGQVNVQVLIDEKGRVLSASAMNGHPLLRRDAENAARNAKFTPTYLTGVAVKVNGVIIYNFKL